MRRIVRERVRVWIEDYKAPSTALEGASAQLLRIFCFPLAHPVLGEGQGCIADATQTRAMRQ
jgi:hypothetical protein